MPGTSSAAHKYRLHATNASTKKTAKTARTAKKTTRKTSTKRPVSKKASAKARDPRLPAVGEKLTRKYKGREIEVLVTDDGFKFEDQTFKSISAVARRIVGYQISGPVFFRLNKPGEEK